MSKIDVNAWIYKEASEHADKVLESIFPKIREALIESYAKGFGNATALATNYNIKHKNENSQESI